MTWIEDLADVYAGEAVDNSSPLKNEEASPLKNEEAIAPSNLRGKEETEEEATAGGGANTKDIQTKTTTLTAFGVAKTVAERLAQERSLEDVHGWIDYARRADGLQNPAAFVVARLRDGEDPPDNDTDNEADERHRYAEWLQQ
jgi:preprotein translocase subunit SecD